MTKSHGPVQEGPAAFMTEETWTRTLHAQGNRTFVVTDRLGV